MYQGLALFKVLIIHRIIFNITIHKHFSIKLIAGPQIQDQRQQVHGCGGLHHRLLSPREDEEAYIQSIVYQTCKKTSSVSPGKKSSQSQCPASTPASSASSPWWVGSYRSTLSLMSCTTSSLTLCFNLLSHAHLKS